MLMVSLIQANLATRRLGREITYYPHTGSTNDDLWELLSDEEAETGHVVITDHQREGKGRQGRGWSAAPGLALTFSVLLEVAWPVERYGHLALAAGVAAAGALQEFDLRPALKWPNDILVDGRKLGGILAEVRQDRIVLGVGLNVNEQASDLPAGLRDRAISVRMAGGQSIQRERLLAEILNRLEVLLASEPEDVREQWLALCGHLDQTVNFNGGDGPVEGKFTGLDENGQALVELAGKVRSIAAGDLTPVP